MYGELLCEFRESKDSANCRGRRHIRSTFYNTEMQTQKNSFADQILARNRLTVRGKRSDGDFRVDRGVQEAQPATTRSRTVFYCVPVVADVGASGREPSVNDGRATERVAGVDRGRKMD